jgi:hypothetical protein
MAAAAAVVGGPTALHDWTAPSSVDAVTVGQYLRARAEPGDTAYVLYTDASVLYYSGLRAGFPYNWSLMMRAAPHAQAKLRSDLASAQRPTWIVKWQSTHAFGLDRNGATRRLLLRDYRKVATLCGRPLFLARGAVARPAPASLQACGTPAASPVRAASSQPVTAP